ncbi:hypothetical protein FX983_02527 [Pseudomonas frederiksbergensis]|uniref:Uncharacterized protein n=1 Tax=Pseudomonas frederiksbergensis TaxID=104087 RepID=A0A6L5C0K3_9PSED|nr:hypothetical protein FX983_02527 [Pseudomonas frederiksbergensis]
MMLGFGEPVLDRQHFIIEQRCRTTSGSQVSQHIGEGLQRFYGLVTATSTPLLEVVESEGYEAAQRVISRLFHGQVAPVEGHVIRL